MAGYFRPKHTSLTLFINLFQECRLHPSHSMHKPKSRYAISLKTLCPKKPIYQTKSCSCLYLPLTHYNWINKVFNICNLVSFELAIWPSNGLIEFSCFMLNNQCDSLHNSSRIATKNIRWVEMIFWVMEMICRLLANTCLHWDSYVCDRALLYWFFK